MPASALTLLVSLYLPWQESHTPFTGRLDGWSTGDGGAAALVALALGFAAVLLLVRPRLAGRWITGSLAIALAYLTAGIGLQVHAEAAVHLPAFGAGSTTFEAAGYAWTYGSWIGLAAGGVALGGGVILCRRDLARRLDAADALAVALGLGILASFLLPWITSSAIGRFPGLEAPTATIAALVLLLGARRIRLPAAVAVAILVGASATIVASLKSELLYGAWIGIGCSVALVAVLALRARPLTMPAAPRGWAAARTAAELALVVALFLPWEKLAIPHQGTFALDGWQELAGAAAGALALLLLVVPRLPYAVETVAAIAFLVAWIETGFGSFTGFHMAYGAYVCLAAASVLVVGAVPMLRPVPVSRRTALPVAAAICCVGSVVIPTWNALPQSWTFEAGAVYGWFVVVGLLLGIYLIRAWTRGGRLTLPALGFLALPTLQLIRLRDELGLVWGTWILVGLCLVLVVLGWIEEYGGGLGSFRMPEEIWRVDRLPGAES